MLAEFKNHIKTNLPFLLKGKLLLAISGGLDSVVLTHLCKESKLNFALTHCNVNLRGDDSDGDEDFVLNLAEDWDLEVFVESFETENYARHLKLSTQVAARELRYEWFYELANYLEFDYILTAHHADDSLETYLINSIRGTGLDGLIGIPVVNGNIVRPLLPFSRDAIKDYAISNNIIWREDSSNASDKYFRNKLRYEIIPILKEMNPKVLQNFQATISNLQETQQILADAILQFQNDVALTEQKAIKLDVEKIKRYSNPKAYLFELLRKFNFTEWSDVVDLMDAENGKFVYSTTHKLIKDRDFLILKELKVEEEVDDIYIENPSEILKLPFGTLRFSQTNDWSKKHKNSIYVDAESLKYPLTFRKPNSSDEFHPFGMKGKKKVSKYLKDEKLSLLEKDQVWLLLSDNKIVWVIGMRADERFKVTKNTTHITKLELS